MATKAKAKAKKRTTGETAICTYEVKVLKKAPRYAKHPVSEFSVLKTGKLRNICKKHQTLLSLEWTRARADYRKVYQQARQLVLAGLSIQVPSAKTWQAGDLLRYTNGTELKPENIKAALAKVRTKAVAAGA